MSLAARCPACGTVFRVVEDQLRVSDGWVRCGRCAEVFNAIEALVDVEGDHEPSTLRRLLAEEGRSAQAIEERGTPMDDGPSYRSDAALQASVPAPTPAPAAPTPQPSPGPLATAARQSHAEPLSEDGGSSGGVVDMRAERRSSTAAPQPPAFVLRAERAARWRRPGVRAALAVAALVFGVTLAMQMLMAYSDVVAARWGPARALLAPICAMAACRLEAPRSIDDWVVESSGLVRIEGTSMYRLSVVLRNRSTTALALPAMDLTLNDGNGTIIARRVIPLPQLGVARVALPAATELPLQVTLSAAERVISGYTIEIFYP